MLIIYIYGSRAIFILIYDDQDTVFESVEIQIITYQLIFTRQTISKDLRDNDIHNLQNGRKILW